MSKLKMWDNHSSWDVAETIWDEGANQASREYPIKKLSQMPKMVGITHETAKNLKWKSVKWMVSKDTNNKVLKGFLRHPLRYGWSFIKSVIQKKAYIREGDFFFYGIKNLEDFSQRIQDKDSLFVVGFSYCHKPFECPSGRFSDACIHSFENPICRQCFIGKCVNALPDENVIPLFIPTVHYIGSKIFEIVHSHPEKKVFFLITACEMTLEMFGDWGNMVGIKGIGIRLDGRICNTMEAFELSERGIKPGLTVVLEPTQRVILNIIRHKRQFYPK